MLVVAVSEEAAAVADGLGLVRLGGGAARLALAVSPFGFPGCEAGVHAATTAPQAATAAIAAIRRCLVNPASLYRARST